MVFGQRCGNHPNKKKWVLGVGSGRTQPRDCSTHAKKQHQVLNTFLWILGNSKASAPNPKLHKPSRRQTMRQTPKPQIPSSTVTPAQQLQTLPRSRNVWGFPKMGKNYMFKLYIEIRLLMETGIKGEGQINRAMVFSVQ